MIAELCILIFTFLFIWAILDNYFPTKKYPPGPFRFPILGSIIPFATKRDEPPFIKFKRLTQKYGPITFIKMGQYNTVLVDDFDTAKALLNSEIWVDRPFNQIIAERSYGQLLGIIFSSGDSWKEMRRFSTRALKDFGFGKQTELQSIMEDQLKHLLEKVEETAAMNEPILNVKHLFSMSILNTLWGMVSSVRSSDDDEKIKHLLLIVDNMAKATAIGGSILDLWPQLGKIFPGLTGVNFVRKCIADLQHYFQEVLASRRKDGICKDDNRDFIDMFIKEIDKHKEIKSNPNFYTDEQFVTVITDLFEAGSETSSNTLEFAIYFAIKNPDVQRKIQKEIDEVVGRSRSPKITDRPNMPYTEAALIEVQRLASVLPITVRSSTESCTVGGYELTKNSVGIVNIYSIHMDKTFWGDPFEFRPERFLDAKNNIIPHMAARVIPFGAGKRVCIGEQMARSSLFIFFATLLQNYNFIEVPGKGLNKPTKESDLEDFMFKNIYHVGFTLSPYPFQARITKR